MFKKIGNSLLIFLLLLQAGGVIFFYQGKQFFLWREMRELIHEANAPVQHMTLSVSDYHKYKVNNSEISVEGKMYDVRSVKITNGTVELVVIHDSEEEKILEAIAKRVRRNDPHNNVPDPLIELITSAYILPVNTWQLEIIDIEQIGFRPHISRVVMSITDITIPPPKAA